MKCPGRLYRAACRLQTCPLSVSLSWPGRAQMIAANKQTSGASTGDQPIWRECDFNERAGIRRALDAEIGTVGLGQSLGQRQAEAGAARAPAAGGRGLTERLERRLDVLLAHARAGVAHAQHRLAAVGENGRDNDLAAGAGEP